MENGGSFFSITTEHRGPERSEEADDSGKVKRNKSGIVDHCGGEVAESPRIGGLNQGSSASCDCGDSC